MKKNEKKIFLLWLRSKGHLAQSIWTDEYIDKISAEKSEYKLHVALVTATQGRFAVFELFCKYWSKMAQELKDENIDLSIYCAVSEVESEMIAKKYGINITYVENNPLYRKHNHATILAKNSFPDYCLFVGADDLMNKELLKYYFELMMENKYGYIGVLDWMFYDADSKSGSHWKGYRENYRIGEPCGAGRAISAEILRMMNWQPWIQGYDKMLDEGFRKNMDTFRPTQKFFLIHQAGEDACGLDIKTSVNMTPFRKWDNTDMIDSKEILQRLQRWFGSELANEILNMNPDGEHRK